MLKDINPPKVENIAVAVVRELNEKDETVWNVYMLNLKTETIEGVLVSSRGYGEIDGKGKETVEFRHFLNVLPPKSFQKVEMIVEDVFAINNEFWVSFYLHNQMYDKKYFFLAESIKEENFVTIPLINKKGVMIM